MLSEKAESYRNAVEYGLANAKKTLIIDLDVLKELYHEVDFLREQVVEHQLRVGRQSNLIGTLEDKISKCFGTANDG